MKTAYKHHYRYPVPSNPIALAIAIAGLTACDPVPAPPDELVNPPTTIVSETQPDGTSTVETADGVGEDSNSPEPTGNAQNPTQITLTTDGNDFDWRTSTLTEETVDDTTVWTIDGSPTSKHELDAMASMLKREIESQAPPYARAELLAELDDPDAMRQKMVAMQLMAKAATADGLHQQDEVKGLQWLSDTNVLIQNFLNDKREAAVANTDLNAWYQQHLIQFQVTEVEFRGITVTTEEKAIELKALAEAEGGDFETLATEHSTEAGKMLADMGSMPLSEVAPFIRNQVEGLAAGGISAPIQTPMGEWMLVLLKNRTDGVKTLEDATPEIKTKIADETEQTIIMTLQSEGQIEQAEPPAEGVPVPEDPIVMTINGQPYTQSFFIQAVTPQFQMEQQAVFQQLQAQLATVPEAERAAKEAELMQQVQPYFMQVQQQLMEMVIQQILVRDEATKQGYASSAGVTTEQALRRLVLLANVYAEKQAQALILEGGSPDQTFAEELVRKLWEQVTISDANGALIPPPEPIDPSEAPAVPAGLMPPPSPVPTPAIDPHAGHNH